MRLRDRSSGTCFVADSAKVYGDLQGRGSIGRGDEVDEPLAERVLESAQIDDEWFIAPVPGNVTSEGNFEVRGLSKRSMRC